MPFAWPHEAVAAVSFAFDGDSPSCLRLRGLLASVGCRATFYVDAPILLNDVDGWRAAIAKGHEIGNHALWAACDSDGLLPHLSQTAIEEEVDDLRTLLSETFVQPAHSAALPLVKTLPDESGLPLVPQVVQRTVTRLNESALLPVLASRYSVVRLGGGQFFRLGDELARVPTCRVDGMDAVGIGLVTQVAVSQGAWVVLSATDPDADAMVQVAKYLLRQPVWLAPIRDVARHIRESSGIAGALESV